MTSPLRLRLRWDEIAARLGAEGWQRDDAAAPLSQTPADSPWYVRVLVGAGAWLAAVFLIASVFAWGIGTGRAERLAWAAIGVASVATATVGLRRRSGDFVTQFLLAISVAGQVLTGFGLADREHAVPVVLATLEAALIALIRHPVHQALSTWGLLVALMAMVAQHEVPFGADVLVLAAAAVAGMLWVRAPDRVARHGGVDPAAGAAHALVFAVLAGLVFVTFALRGEFGVTSSLLTTRVASVGLGLMVLALALQIRSELGGALAARPGPRVALALAALPLLGIATPGAPGLSATAGAILLGFHRRSPLLVGAGITFLIAFLGLHYYNLQATLLTKSLYLIAAGLVLAGSAWALGPRRAR